MLSNRRLQSIIERVEQAGGKVNPQLKEDTKQGLVMENVISESSYRLAKNIEERTFNYKTLLDKYKEEN